MKKVVTFGEVMMRLSPPGFAKFSQTNTLDVVYGGGEANVAISLAYFGLQASHVTRFPDNIIGYSAAQFLRHHWLDSTKVTSSKHDGTMTQYCQHGAITKAES